MPKVKCLAHGMENDYMLPPTPHCIEWDAFFPLGTGNFVSQDYRMKQTQKILAYAKALWFWVEKGQPPWLSQPHQLAACVHKLRESMELLMSFTNEEFLSNDPPLYWVKITSSRPSKPMESEATSEWSCSRSKRTCPKGSFLVTHSVGHSKPTTSTHMVSSSNTCSQGSKTSLGSPITWKQMPLPSFEEIARSLWGDDSPHITIDIPQELTTSQGLLVETAMMISMQMQQDTATGITYLDTVTASMSLVNLGGYPYSSWPPSACSGGSLRVRLDVIHPSSLCFTLGSIGILTWTPTCSAFYLNWSV